MADEERKDFISDFRRFFGKGLAILLPTVLTLWILVQAYLFVEAQVAEPINRGIRTGVMWVLPKVVAKEESLPRWFRVTDTQVDKRRTELEAQGVAVGSNSDIRDAIRAEQFRLFWDNNWYSRFVGLFVAIVLIYLAGVLLGGFIGRRVYQRIEQAFTRLPIVKQVYPHVKQMVDLILGERPMAFRKAVMVEYPRKGIWTIGLVTSESLRQARDAAGEDVMAVFIPTSPMPFTGFTITIRVSEAIDLPISIDEAIRFFITGGVLVPEGHTSSSSATIDGLPSGDERDGRQEA